MELNCDCVSLFVFANSADSISRSQLLSEAFEVSNIYRTSTFAHEAVSSTDQLTNNCPNMGQLHDIKTFTFSCPLPKKVDWSLSPPSPADSSCRVSEQSSREEFPTSQHSLTTRAWTWYTSILQNLSPGNILTGRGTSMSMQVCLFLFVPRCVCVCACA